jgi:hypothetical protein
MFRSTGVLTNRVGSEGLDRIGIGYFASLFDRTARVVATTGWGGPMVSGDLSYGCDS